jgi:hypothetical protein
MGTIRSGKSRFNREVVGRVAEDGTVYSGRGKFSSDIVGGVEPPLRRFSGAALLVLLR